MPFLFRDLDHWNKVLDGDALQPIADDVAETADVMLIGYAGGGTRNLIVNRPVTKMDDLGYLPNDMAHTEEYVDDTGDMSFGQKLSRALTGSRSVNQIRLWISWLALRFRRGSWRRTGHQRCSGGSPPGFSSDRPRQCEANPAHGFATFF